MRDRLPAHYLRPGSRGVHLRRGLLPSGRLFGWMKRSPSSTSMRASQKSCLGKAGPAVPVYSYVLWLWTRVMGTGEVMLRIPSILAMLGAVYLLYRAARELFDRDVALIAAILFCLHPFVIFESIDIRPYAFGALAITASILALVHLQHSRSSWLAALFGFSAACIVYFQLLFAVILPALAICFFARKIDDRKIFWRQAGVALLAFAIAFLPVIPGIQYMMHTSGAHVFAPAAGFGAAGPDAHLEATHGDPLAHHRYRGRNTPARSEKSFRGLARLALHFIGAGADFDPLCRQRRNTAPHL